VAWLRIAPYLCIMGQLVSIRPYIDALIVPVLINAVIVLFGSLLERIKPVRKQPWSAIRLNLAHLVPYYGLHILCAPLVLTISVWVVNMLGGGWIVLPAGGIAYVAGLAVFVLAMDFSEAAFHMAQHKIPFLWKLHSLHHSDTQVNISTTQRHYWADHAVKSVTIYAWVAVLFKANPAILVGYNIIALWNYFSHMNVRIGFGRYSWVINAPQYHRLHHSSRPEDYNLRYAAILPIFDVICGTYRRPLPGEYADTGLDDGRVPSGLVDAIFWPARR
jgi:sterol desaturase/sphingolipid hydroxylase (fatty acid hydroxylase superfamily)